MSRTFDMHATLAKSDEELGKLARLWLEAHVTNADGHADADCVAHDESMYCCCDHLLVGMTPAEHKQESGRYAEVSDVWRALGRSDLDDAQRSELEQKMLDLEARAPEIIRD